MRAIRQPRPGGFTLIETVLAMAMTVLVLTSSLGLFMAYQVAHHDLGVRVEANRLASMALSRMVYGMGGDRIGLREAGGLALTTSALGWELEMEDDEGDDAGTFGYAAGSSNLYFAPPGGEARSFAESISAAAATLQTNRLILSVRVDLRRGRFAGSQQLETVLRWRN